LLAYGRWFSPGTSASSTTKTGRPDIAESGVKHQKSINKIRQQHIILPPVLVGFVLINLLFSVVFFSTIV
jgi:hypothetical protein